MCRETSKATLRRAEEDLAGIFPWTSEVFVGAGIDVGCGEDPLALPNCERFDWEQGDANHLLNYFSPGTFDYVHASQSLEHMVDPVVALVGWLLVTKPGGHVVVTVPDFVLYEGLCWPSQFNGDHKSTWSMWLKDSPAPVHCYLPSWLDQFSAEIRVCRVIDTGYDYKIGTRTTDQTLGSAEAFIEFVLRRPRLD
jgi:SAM-dependent methyltransferase